MRAQISFDFIMKEDMSFVEGTYRLPTKDWQVFIFGPDASVAEPQLQICEWNSGVTGVFIKWPPSKRLNKVAVLQMLSEEFAITEWAEIQGPDSIMLR